jgi:hypothetical protein
VKKQVSLIGAAAFGAGFVYMADPALGKRRRAIARDAAVHSAKVFRRAVDITARDTAHRLKGFFELGKGAFRHQPGLRPQSTTFTRSGSGMKISRCSCHVFERCAILDMAGRTGPPVVLSALGSSGML